MSFDPRLTSDGLYYGGAAHSYYWDPAVNPNAVPRYCLANCTTYAYGRALEIGSPAPVSVIRNANHWHEVLTNGWTAIPFSYSQVKPGDIIEYASGSSNHVAFVEAVDETGAITTSNSNYTSRDTSLGLAGISQYFQSSAYLRKRFFNVSNERWGGAPTYILVNPQTDPGPGPATKTFTVNEAIALLALQKKRRTIIYG